MFLSRPFLVERTMLGIFSDGRPLHLASCLYSSVYSYAALIHTDVLQNPVSIASITSVSGAAKYTYSARKEEIFIDCYCARHAWHECERQKIRQRILGIPDET